MKRVKILRPNLWAGETGVVKDTNYQHSRGIGRKVLHQANIVRSDRGFDLVAENEEIKPL